MPVMTLRFLVPSAFALLTVAWAGPAFAQSPLSEGNARLELADFEGAVAAFDRIEAADSGLTRAQLVELYSLRSSAHLALGDDSAMEADIRRLAALDPDHEFGPATRPEVRQAYERFQGAAGPPLSVVAAPHEEPGAVRIDADVRGDSVDLTRSVRVRARVGDGEWLVGDRSLMLPATEGSRVQYLVEAVGPGGAVLAAEGTESAPRSYEVTGAIAAGPRQDGHLDADDGDDGGSNAIIWIAVIGGIAAAALIAVMVGVAVSGSNDSTNPDVPMIFP